MNPGKFLFILLLPILITPGFLFGDEFDDFRLRTGPIIIGEEAFRRRLEEVSPGKEPLGLLLSGGSARAYAHIGVLKRLEEAGIVPDFIVANSMGAVVATLYAAGLSPTDIELLIQTIPMESLFEPVLPSAGGILDASGFMDLLYGIFGDLRLEELAIPVLLLCDDLVSRRQVWITEGDYYSVLKATFAMPLLFSPLPWDDMRLVDGGTSNLVPVNALAAFTSRMLVSSTFYDNKKLNYTNMITIFQVNIGIGKERRAMEMIQEYQPMLIRCDVENLSFMDYSNTRELVERGYSSADRMIDQILEEFGPGGPDLTAVRAKTAEPLRKAQKAVVLGNPLYKNQGSILWKLRLYFPDSFHYERQLLNKAMVSLGFKASKGRFAFSLGAITSFLDPEIKGFAELTIAPLGPLSWESFFIFTHNNLYAHTQFEANFALPAGFRFTPFLRGEIQNLEHWVIGDGWYRAGFRIDLLDEKYIFNPGLSFYGFFRHPDIPGIAGDVKLVIKPFYPMELRGRYLLRYAFDRRDNFPPFSSDGYRGRAPAQAVLPQGLGNFDLAFNMNRLSFGFGEAIILQKLDAGLFFDILHTFPQGHNGQEMPPYYATGVSLNFQLSLAGLIPLRFTFYSAYDFTAEKNSLSFRIGSLF